MQSCQYISKKFHKTSSNGRCVYSATELKTLMNELSNFSGCKIQKGVTDNYMKMNQ